MLAMLAIVLLAALVVLYVAFPHRGQDVPNAPWVGDALYGVTMRGDGVSAVVSQRLREAEAVA